MPWRLKRAETQPNREVSSGFVEASRHVGIHPSPLVPRGEGREGRGLRAGLRCGKVSRRFLIEADDT